MKALFVLIILLILVPQTQAIYDPLSVPNNKYGIHIADPQDIPNAAALVNSNGDWGYVTLVIQENDRNTDKWQRIFDQMRRLHVIPIVRIATRPEGNTWRKPVARDIGNWKAFLHSLNWPTQNRYVILFNEPNQAAEWGNLISPEEYADIFMLFARELKATSEDFFILSAGLDASAPNSNSTMNEEVFLERVIAKQPEFLSLLDGWTSHSYPNPGFSGSPAAAGRGTLRTYQWELTLIGKHLPVFITETGWQHQSLTFETIAQYLIEANEGVWSDPRIVAITPFIFNYQGAPFTQFSWVRLGGEGFYDHYYTWRDLPKTGGQPRQRELYEVITPLLPSALVADATTTLIGTIKNTGQAITNPVDYRLEIKEPSGSFQVVAGSVPTLEPGESGKISVHIKTPAKEGNYSLSAHLIKGQTEIGLESADVALIPPAKLTISVAAGWRPNPNIGDVSVLIYNSSDEIVHEFDGLTIKNGQILVEGLKNIVPDQSYRIVVLVGGYLPRQTYVSLDPKHTVTQMRRLLPLDFNFDGALSLEDIGAILQTRPHDAWYRFFGP